MQYGRIGVPVAVRPTKTGESLFALSRFFHNRLQEAGLEHHSERDRYVFHRVPFRLNLGVLCLDKCIEAA
jgi:hypothetical protein